MGLFDLFGSKDDREKSTLRKLAKKVTERYGPPENRQKAIDQLGQLGTPGALSALCLRFTIRTDPGITDDEEKESVREILVAAGDAALTPVAQFLREQEIGIAWGLRALAGVAPPEKVVEIVVRELSRLGGAYSRDPDKKLVLLTWLAEHHAGAGATELESALLPLLEDFSDDVRINATRAARARRGRSRRPHPAAPARPRQRARARRGARRARHARRRREGVPTDGGGAARRAVLPRSRGAREEARVTSNSAAGGPAGLHSPV